MALRLKIFARQRVVAMLAALWFEIAQVVNVLWRQQLAGRRVAFARATALAPFLLLIVVAFRLEATLELVTRRWLMRSAIA